MLHINESKIVSYLDILILEILSSRIINRCNIHANINLSGSKGAEQKELTLKKPKTLSISWDRATLTFP